MTKEKLLNDLKFKEKCNEYGLSCDTYFYEKYSKQVGESPFNGIFDYPFENFTLKKFIDLSNVIDMLEFEDEKTEYLKLVSYIKFISKEIKSQFMTIYQLKLLGIEATNLNSYLRLLIKNINANTEIDKKGIKRRLKRIF